ncbi:MAG: hypothetical protein GY795_01455 [Desulfobacterales bacterium]|nr:hypothetical protein [Desulfobacterales bacterium]
MGDYAKIIVEKNSLPTLKESISIAREVLEKKLAAYKNRIKKFEETSGMNTETFTNRFETGELGDDKEWIEWDHLANVITLLQKKLNDIENIRYES